MSLALVTLVEVELRTSFGAKLPVSVRRLSNKRTRVPFVAIISTCVQRPCSTCHADEERLRAPACRATPAAPAALASALIVRQITGPAVGQLRFYLQLQLHIVCNFAGLRRHVTVSYGRPVCLLISTTMIH